MHHAPYRRRVFAFHYLLHSAEAQTAYGLAHVAGAADEAAYPFDAKSAAGIFRSRFCHFVRQTLSSLFAYAPRLAPAPARLASTFSAANLPPISSAVRPPWPRLLAATTHRTSP